MEQQQQQMSDDDEQDRMPEIRAFRSLWDALNQWLTPETVAYVDQLERQQPDDLRDDASQRTLQVDRSDIGASRCAGLMAMIKLYLPSCLEELHQPPSLRRRAEHRLGNLLRTLDYSREAPKLQVSFWKAMTCVVLEMVLVETRQEGLPSSVAAIGMTLEEYRCLTRSVIQGFVVEKE